MKLLIECSLLILPELIYALWNGRKGIKHPAVLQTLWVANIMMIVAIGVSTYEYFTAYPGSWNHLRWVTIKCLAVAITGYGLLFPLAFNWMWYSKFDSSHRMTKTQYILDHLSPTAIPDKYFLKYRIHWGVRLGLYLGLFVGSVLWFAL